MTAEKFDPASGSGDSRTAAIRSDIERTRARLGDTVEALGAQLNPSHLAQRAKDSLREATIGRVQHMANNTKARINQTGRGLAETVRENPLPAVMAAAGIGWLLLAGRDRKEEPRRFYDGEEVFDADSNERHSSRLREAGAGIAEGVHGMADKAQDATQRMAHSAQETAHRVADRAKEAGESIGRRADAAMHQVRDRTRAASDRVEHKYQENPVALGAVALALGLAVGMSAPRTRREVELVGDKRDRLMDKAREKVASTTEKVEGVIERALPEVQAVVRDAAREEGLTR